MVHYCSAFGCKEKFVKGSKVTFHCFPKDPKRRSLWEAQLRREGFKATNHSRICSKHFEKNCFETEILGGSWLKKDAVPTIFSEHLQKKKVKRKLLTIREMLAGETCPTTSISNGDQEKASPPKSKKRGMKRLRNLGDFDEADMQSPTKARKVLHIAQNCQTESQKQIKKLMDEKRLLQKKIVSSDEKLTALKKTHMVTESASSVSQLYNYCDQAVPGTLTSTERRPKNISA